MLKGYVFSKQLFENPIFALFINTFLNGQNGISNNYKNGMAVSYSGSNITISSGAVCIQGRFLGEDTSTTLNAGTNNLYCKLVIEIDLDKQNTETELNQASYKIVTSGTGYPNLTQTNIVKNNTGIYQYELARFRTVSSGITDFQDMRTFLDFDSIYEQIQSNYQSVLDELQQELANVKDGSDYLLKSTGGTVEGPITANGGLTGNLKGNVTGNTSGSSGSCTGNAATATKLKNARTISLTGDVTGSTSFDGSKNVSINTNLANVAVLSGSVTLQANTSENLETDSCTFTEKTISYPSGFNKDNCTVISAAITGSGKLMYGFGWTNKIDSTDLYNGIMPVQVILYGTTSNSNSNKIKARFGNYTTSQRSVDYKIVLMKTS